MRDAEVVAGLVVGAAAGVVVGVAFGAVCVRASLGGGGGRGVVRAVVGLRVVVVGGGVTGTCLTRVHAISLGTLSGAYTLTLHSSFGLICK